MGFHPYTSPFNYNIYRESVIQEYFNVWPVKLDRGWYRVYFATLPYVKKFYCFWKDEKGNRHKLPYWAKKIEGENWQGRRHHIHSIAREVINRPFCVVQDGKIVDGNHRMCALVNKKYKGSIMVIEWNSKVSATSRRKKL